MRRTMDIGRLRKRVSLYRLEDVLDEMGQSKQDLVKIAEVWGDLKPIRGSEFYELKKIQSKVSHKLYIRWRADYENIDSTWYVECDGRRYDMDSVINVDLANKMLEIGCYEHVDKESRW